MPRNKAPIHEKRKRPVPTEPDSFLHEYFLKADFFSRSDYGTYRADGAQQPSVRRDIGFSRLWLRPIANWFGRREKRALVRLKGVADTPELLYASRRIIVRSWIGGRPMQEAEPRDPAYFRAARLLLIRLHRAGIAHNDLAKQQNWLVKDDGMPALIDFQLASTRRRRTRVFRLMAREDLRHLLKHKRMYCPDALTPSEKRMLATPSLPSRIWRKTGKVAYNFVTRRILHWQDGEGTGELAPAQRKPAAKR